MSAMMKCPACGVIEEHICVTVSGNTHSTFSYAVPGRSICRGSTKILGCRRCGSLMLPPEMIDSAPAPIDAARGG